MTILCDAIFIWHFVFFVPVHFFLMWQCWKFLLHTQSRAIWFCSMEMEFITSCDSSWGNRIRPVCLCFCLCIHQSWQKVCALWDVGGAWMQGRFHVRSIFDQEELRAITISRYYFQYRTQSFLLTSEGEVFLILLKLNALLTVIPSWTKMLE